ncbi:MAG: hypothetical protein J6N76_01155, partial [Lachnospiraceae bacterium]|nr:hypothetical protein [Lachnospiraceae bacterium]
TVFMAICPAQIYNARLTVSEMLAQAFFLAAAWLFAVGWKRDERLCLYLSAGFAAAGSFIRIDNYLLYIPYALIGIYTALCRPEKTKVMRRCEAIVIIGAVAAFGYSCMYHIGYIEKHWDGLLQIVFPLALILNSVAYLLLLYRSGIKVGKKKHKAVINPGVLAEVITGRTFLLIMSAVAAIAVTFFLTVHVGIGFEGRALLEYSWYVSALALYMAIIGTYGFLRLCGQNESAKKMTDIEAGSLYFFYGILSMLLYIARPSITWDHLWASRRWIVAGIPFVLMMAAAGTIYLWDMGKEAQAAKGRDYSLVKKVACRSLAILAGTFITGYMVYQYSPFMSVRLFEGMDKDYEALAKMLPDEDIILTDKERVASMLKYVYHKNIYLINGKDAVKDINETEGTPESPEGKGDNIRNRNIYLLTDSVSEDEAQPVGDEYMEIGGIYTEGEMIGIYPHKPEEIEIRLKLYRLMQEK